MGHSRSASKQLSRRYHGGGLVVLAALAALCAVAPAANAAFPGTNGRIAFASQRDGGDMDVFTMNQDGTGIAQLTANADDDRYTAWSADGAKLAFTSNRDGGDNDIFVMNADGSAQTQLTFNSADDLAPVWSPDGTKIAFGSNQDGGDYDVFTMDANGAGQVQLTTGTAQDTSPAWSPDGQTIAFQTDRDGEYQIYLMGDDGSGQTRLTFGGFQDVQPTWDPDGSRLAFRRDGAGNQAEVYVINADGSGETAISNHAAYEDLPVFSPDGNRILFSSNRDEVDFEMYRMNATGSGAVRLTNSSGFDGYHDWQPIRAYARPAGASPLRVSLVPAYEECTAPNASRSEGFPGQACNPPVMISEHLTVGTPELNGQPARSTGHVRMAVAAGSPPASVDDADIVIETSITDVRRQDDLDDYTGELLAQMGLRITDRGGGTASDTSTTSVEIPLEFSVPCTATVDPEGSECALATTVDTLVGGRVLEGRRSIFKAGDVQVFDGGADGDADTPPNTLFAWQGLFVP